MNLKINNTPFSRLPKAYTRVVFEEKGPVRLVEKGGKTELHIPAGKDSERTARTFRTMLRGVVATARALKQQKVAIDYKTLPLPKNGPYDAAWVASTVAENILIAAYEHTAYKSKRETRDPREISLCGTLSKEEKEGFRRGKIVAESVNFCRDIANTSGGDMTPELLAKAAKEAAKGTDIKVTILDDKKLAELKMGAVLAVGQGAKDKPRFIVMEYKGADDKDEKPLVLVGKGITFDTGGLQIKPGMAMHEMHMDMSGGASVIAAIIACAKLGVKRNIITLVPSAENAVSGESMRPGDVIHSMSGKTIEVLHTDAEGRLVLADALHYARQYRPSLVIDVATLTGAALVALGRHASAILTKDRELEDTLRDLGEKSGDYVAPLPLWDEYMEYTKGVHADVANIPPGDSRDGGTINGAAFLANFTKGLRWAHIDMAPRMTPAPCDRLAKGATGEPVRLLVSIAENL